MSVNKVILIGRLGKDVELRVMTNGESVANCSLATTESYKDKSGEKVEKTEWHNLVFYRRLAEIAGEYLKKGSMIYIEGKLQTRKYTDKAGVEKYSTEIIVNEMTMLGGKPSGGDSENSDARPAQASRPQSQGNRPAQTAAPARQAPAAAGSNFGSFNSDDIPFAPVGMKGADVDWRNL